MHALHAFAPLSSWYSPTGHLVQMLAPGLELKVPGAQAVGFSLPVLHALPAGQASQSPAAARLVELEKVPARHGSGADEPGAQ